MSIIGSYYTVNMIHASGRIQDCLAVALLTTFLHSNTLPLPVLALGTTDDEKVPFISEVINKCALDWCNPIDRLVEWKEKLMLSDPTLQSHEHRHPIRSLFSCVCSQALT
jgi:hypothetical protein